MDRIVHSRSNLVASMGDKGFIKGVVTTERICCYSRIGCNFLHFGMRAADNSALTTCYSVAVDYTVSDLTVSDWVSSGYF